MSLDTQITKTIDTSILRKHIETLKYLKTLITSEYETKLIDNIIEYLKTLIYPYR